MSTENSFLSNVSEVLDRYTSGSRDPSSYTSTQATTTLYETLGVGHGVAGCNHVDERDRNVRNKNSESATKKQYKGLLAQIIHDLISSFTSLSAGLDLLIPKERDDMWTIIAQIKEKMYAQISLMRYLFSTGDGYGDEGLALLAAYGKFYHVHVVGQVEDYEKARIALGFWLMKKAHKQGGVLSFSRSAICLEGAQGSKELHFTQRDHDIICDGIAAGDLRDSYGLYAHGLIKEHRLGVRLEHMAQGLALSLGHQGS